MAQWGMAVGDQREPIFRIEPGRDGRTEGYNWSPPQNFLTYRIDVR